MCPSFFLCFGRGVGGGSRDCCAEGPLGPRLVGRCYDSRRVRLRASSSAFSAVRSTKAPRSATVLSMCFSPSMIASRLNSSRHEECGNSAAEMRFTYSGSSACYGPPERFATVAAEEYLHENSRAANPIDPRESRDAVVVVGRRVFEIVLISIPLPHMSRRVPLFKWPLP